MSSTYKSYQFGAERCIDSDIGGRVCHTNCGVNSPWLEVDMGSNHYVGFVVLHSQRKRSSAARLGEYEVWVGTKQGERTTRCVSAEVPEDWRKVKTLVHPCEAEGRFVTLLLPGNDRCLNLLELRLLSQRQQPDASPARVTSSSIYEDEEVDPADGSPESAALNNVRFGGRSEVGMGSSSPFALTVPVMGFFFAILAAWTALLYLFWRCWLSRSIKTPDAFPVPRASVAVEPVQPPPAAVARKQSSRLTKMFRAPSDEERCLTGPIEQTVSDEERSLTDIENRRPDDVSLTLPSSWRSTELGTPHPPPL